MTIVLSPTITLADAQMQFEAALPRMDTIIRYAFQRWPREHIADAVSEAHAAAWCAWCGLIRRGKDPLSVGITGIAYNAARYVKNGRRVGNPKAPGRGLMDIHNPRAQRRSGFGIVSFESEVSPTCKAESAAWKDCLVGNKRFTPADEAVFRIDFAVWLGGLPSRKRQMAELLAEGQETGAIARTLGVTPSAVSQARPWLEMSWRTFQRQADAV